MSFQMLWKSRYRGIYDQMWNYVVDEMNCMIIREIYTIIATKKKVINNLWNDVKWWIIIYTGQMSDSD